MSAPPARLRQVDVKAEHFERQVTRLEQERDQWEKKYEVRSKLRIPFVLAPGVISPLAVMSSLYDRRAANVLLYTGSTREVSGVQAGARRAGRAQRNTVCVCLDGNARASRS